MPERKYGNATAMAGEFFVMERLYRLGHQPALTVGAAKSIDILVKTNDDIATDPQVFVIPAREVEALKRRWFEKDAVFYSNEKDRRELESYRNAWNYIS